VVESEAEWERLMPEAEERRRELEEQQDQS
jgi:hypothetical protein